MYTQVYEVVRAELIFVGLAFTVNYTTYPCLKNAHYRAVIK